MLLLCVVCEANADVVAVLVGSNTPIATSPGGADLVISLNPISADTTLRIFDAATNGTTAPSLSVGRITFNGSIIAGTGAHLKVLVANSVITDVTGDPRAAFLPGVVNLGTASGGLVITDIGLRDATSLALAVSATNADFNHDHELSVQDTFDFLAAWFAGTGCQ